MKEGRSGIIRRWEKKRERNKIKDNFVTLRDDDVSAKNKFENAGVNTIFGFEIVF